MPIYHLTARSRGWLYTADFEAAHLWDLLRAAFPEALACCLMPDHIHLLLPHADPAHRLARVRRGYTRWLGRRPRWLRQPFAWAEPGAPVELAPDPGHTRRTIRYILLNPCRAGLVRDPLAWVWSTHRDAVGLVANPWVNQRNPASFHAYVSGDPTVDIAGTALPTVQGGKHALSAISRGVGAVLRMPAPEVTVGAPRTLALQTAGAFGHTDVRVLADWANCSIRAAQRGIAAPTSPWQAREPVLDACLRCTGDDRFEGPQSGDLPRTMAWQAYARRRAEKPR